MSSAASSSCSTEYTDVSVLWSGLGSGGGFWLQKVVSATIGQAQADLRPFPTYNDLLERDEWILNLSEVRNNPSIKPLYAYRHGSTVAPSKLAGRFNSLFGYATSVQAYPDPTERAFVRLYENKYRNKANATGPRSWRLAESVLKAFFGSYCSSKSLSDWRVISITPEEIIDALELAGVKCRSFKSFTPSDIRKAGKLFGKFDPNDYVPPLPGESNRIEFKAFDFQPPRRQASSGLYYRTADSCWYGGPKKDIWSVALGDAVHTLEELCNLGLTWSIVDDMHKAKAYFMNELWPKYRWVFAPAWRTDGGPIKLRKLLIGTIAMFILETWAVQPLREAIQASLHFPYRHGASSRFAREVWSGKMISGDFKAHDRHISPWHLKAAFQALAVLLNWPESLAVALFMYYCFTPTIVVGADGKAYLQWRNGGNPSGCGLFVWINNMMNAWAQYKNWITLVPGKPWEPGVMKGDDHLQLLPASVGVTKWMANMSSNTGFEMDEIDTRAHANIGIFCRDFYKPGPDGVVIPVVCSRAENGVFPERLTVDPNISIVLRALRYRAQSVPVIVWFGTSPISSDKQVLQVWDNLLPPQHRLEDLVPLDADLSRTYQELKHLATQAEQYVVEDYLYDIAHRASA